MFAAMTKPRKRTKPDKPYVRPTRQIGLRLPKDMLDWLEAEAKADDRNVPYLIRLAVTQMRERRHGAEPAKNRRRPAATE